MNLVDLVADRFAVAADGRVLDLATGHACALAVASAGGPTEQTRWGVRCDLLQKLHHRAIARLVDYGALGETQRFEAWRCGPIWQGARAQGEEVCRRAAAFLRSSGLTAGPVSRDAVRYAADTLVVLPDPAAGYPAAPCDARGRVTIDIDSCGMMLPQRRAVPAIAELFDAHAGGGGGFTRVVSLCGDAGAGKTALVAELARAARLKGFVPVSVRMLGATSVCALLRGRSLFLIDDDTGAGWAGLLGASIQSPRSHVLVVTGREEVPTVDVVSLEPCAPDLLASSIRPADLSPALAVRVQRAAVRAGGSPGRFARLLWRRPPSTGEPSARGRRPASRAAEQAAVYGAEDPVADAPPESSPNPPEWPAPGELVALGRRIDAARRLLESGRHAPGERMLRQALGALVRRGAWAHAVEGALTLAGAMLKRGRARRAAEALDEAREYGSRAGNEEALARAAILAGCAWTDLTRLDEADSVLAAALAAARARGWDGLTVDAALGFARVAFWRGRYADADQMLASIAGVELSARAAVPAGVMAARVAVGRRDVERAVGSAVDALDRARHLGDAGLIAEAEAAKGFVHLAVGDLDAVDRDVAACLAAARAARDPLRSLRARLLLAESARRRDRVPAVHAFLQRVSALGGSGVPPIVHARCALLKELAASAAHDADIVKRHVRATGLEALALFVPVASASLGDAAPSVDDVLEILRVCQNAEEEQTVLTDVCARVRRQLRAAAAAFVGQDAGALVTMAAEGGRIEPDIAERVIAAQVAIAPHRHQDRIEAAAPVKYGGAVVGVLAVRWTLGGAHNVSAAPATSLLAMAATAAAPAVAAALARRTREAPTASTSLLLGSSAALAGVRHAVERAARAPFPVLIEGESGSGKELIARALHRGSPRRDRTFCTLNCAALPDDLVESELFGHARGAFTGAVAERPGVFEEAHGGTLFLDEVGELSPRAQAKVLRVIQEGELRRVGENVSRRVDVRIVAATNRDLRAEVAAARFRLDLLYRLDVVRIVVPPVRERREDIAPLAEHFWRETTARIGSRATLSAATIAALARYDWPGNVRELQNVLASLAVRSSRRGVVPPAALPPLFGECRAEDTWRLDQARRTFEERFVRAALVRSGGHRARAATELGVSRQGLTKLLTRLGIAD
jgi:transcriptional regulator with GAF, ATPase, and Fis domain